MATAVDASSAFTGDPTNAQPHTFVGPSVSAPAGALVLVFASCNAASGHPTSKIDVTAVSGGHTATLIKRLSQADGGGSQNAPIGVWAFVANGAAFQVTQVDTSAGFAMSQAVYVITGADTSLAALSFATFTGTGTPTISGTATLDGSMVVLGLNDWNNTQDLPAGASGMTTDKAIQGSADAIPTYYGHKAVNSGAFSVGTTALAHQGGTNAIAVLVPSAAAQQVTSATATVVSAASASAIKRAVSSDQSAGAATATTAAVKHALSSSSASPAATATSSSRKTSLASAVGGLGAAASVASQRSSSATGLATGIAAVAVAGRKIAYAAVVCSAAAASHFTPHAAVPGVLTPSGVNRSTLTASGHTTATLTPSGRP